MSTVNKLISFDSNIAAELEAVPEALHISQKELVERALMMYFDHLDEKIADKRLDDLKSGKEKTIPAEEVFRELGL